MLVEFKVKNFLSIKDEVVLSLDSTSSNNLEDNLFQVSDYRLLKTAAIYGPNASGKSNLMKAVSFALNMIRNSQQFKVDTKFLCIPFLLDEGSKLDPSRFEFTFIKNQTRYTYGFSCDENGFIEEFLYYKPQGENRKIFFKRNEGSSNGRFRFFFDKNDQMKWGKETIKQRLYLPKAVNDHNYEKMTEVYDYLVNDLVVVMQVFDPSWGYFTRDRIMKDPKFKEWCLNIIKKADFGGIEDIRINREKRILKGFNFNLNDGSISSEPLERKEEDYYDLNFVHRNDMGEEILFKEDLESTGTNKTLNMMGPIYDIMENGKTLLIDEFELNLHPNITEFIIRLFHSKQNKRNGQLVITTHDTTLLKKDDIFRRDQVYICTKEPNRSTNLSSLIEFDLRESINFENAYLNGRLGGLPFIDESVFEG